jgi:hypothetical protein
LNDVNDFSGFVSEGGNPVARATPLLGDNAIAQELRAILTFDITTIPPGAQIDAATFEVTETGTEGDPFVLGVAIVDHIDSAGAYDAEIFDGYHTWLHDFAIVNLAPAKPSESGA